MARQKQDLQDVIEQETFQKQDLQDVIEQDLQDNPGWLRAFILNILVNKSCKSCF